MSESKAGIGEAIATPNGGGGGTMMPSSSGGGGEGGGRSAYEMDSRW